MKLKSSSYGNKKRSLYKDISATLVVGIILVSFLSIFLSILIITNNAKKDYKNKSNEFIEFLAQSLIRPVWDVNNDGIQRVCDAFAKNEMVVFLKITDVDRGVLYEKATDVNEIWAARKTDILFNNKVIGHIELALSPIGYRAVFYQFLSVAGFILLMVLLTIFFGIQVILKKILKAPLSQLTNRIEKISAGDYGYGGETSPYIEIQSVMNVFDRMAASIHAREAELAMVNRRLAFHVENTPLGVIEWDPNFRVVQWNKAAEEIFGYTKSEALGKTGPELIVPPKDRPLVDQIWKALKTGKGGRYSTNENITKDNGVKIANWYNTTLYDENGNAVGVASLVQDITEYKKLEGRLRQAQKLEAIGTLSGGIAHDFNNILSPILGFTEMLKDDLPPESPHQRYISQILKAALRAKELIRQILSFSRKGDQKISPLKLQPIFREAAKLLSSSIPKTIRLDAEIDQNCGTVLADGTQIHQIIMNLATNAYHAMQETGGRLKISLSETVIHSRPIGFIELIPGTYAHIMVSDTGVGIKKELLDKVFDPYFTTKPMDKGTGLGLAVVQAIVKSYHGEIHIYSEPDIGTQVHVYLPIIQAPDEVKEIFQEKALLGNNEKILVVDDEKDVADMQKQLLSRLGYKVTSTTEGSTALEIISADSARFDLVITDMTMPEMTGVQLAGEIRKLAPNLPVIVSTGFSDHINKENAKKLGLSDFVMKPVTKEELGKTVARVLKKQIKEIPSS